MLILASASPRRLGLLQQAGIEPDILMPADLDETPARGEHPRSLAKRLSREKAEATARRVAELNYDNAYVLAADTVVCVGRDIMPKAELQEDALANLRVLSGRAHRVYTGVSLITPRGSLRQRLVETKVRFKRLSREDIDRYLRSGEWRGKAGGYAIQGRAGAFVLRLIGSYTNVVGLPLYETVNLLAGEGYDIDSRTGLMLDSDDEAGVEDAGSDGSPDIERDTARAAS
ncbi:Maf-like protein [Fulvimarina sp. 2208YS6-2-32]|uniref:dTTP/UTP pyrophosphatase n=1 Tax=Fulvimarina uroteuthidis TaxID=3098149 RepID=A0ABU5I3A1_9HYPH|nr:Maf-like protein [Fulvimarina sp. 2208YS6-2-32]MDY8109443.1 Maf-like protein [Fulvimarina sp. 2208YS6-2-32]